MANKREPVKQPRYCPYCDAEIAEAAFPYCQACEVEIFYCPECQKPLSRDNEVCPNCGANIRRKGAKRGK